MLINTKVFSTEIDSLARRIVKFLRYGLKDVQTSVQVAPYGVDSNPVKDMIAIYGPTSEKGQTVIIGYINKNQLAGIGEFRTFSTDENGAVKFYTWLKNDGTMEIGGDAKNMVRYQELETAFNELKGKFNSLVQAYNTHAHAGVTTGGGTSGTTPATATESTADISGAKIEEIKTL